MVSERLARARGFTLVELMITLGVVGALAAIAVPSVKETIAKQRVRSASGDLLNTMMRTRSFAIKLQLPVTMTPVSASAWQAGWSVPNPNGTDYLFDARTVLAQVAIKGPATLTYKSNGRPQVPSTSKFEVSGNGTTEVRCVALDLNGVPYQKKGVC